LERIVPVLIVNVAVVALAATVTDAGTVSTVALVSISVTLAPPTGAAFESVTVHVVEEFGPRVWAAHSSEISVAGEPLSDRLAVCDEPDIEAVSVAL